MHGLSSNIARSAVVALGLLCLPVAWAEPPEDLVLLEDYASAARALEDQAYDIAAIRFTRLLNSPESANFTTADENWITAQIAMAHVRADQPREALSALRKLPPSPEFKFWRAQALVQLGRFEEAEPLLTALLQASPRIHEDSCRFTRARVLAELGRLPEAVGELEAAMKSDNPRIQARARVALAEAFYKLGRSSEVEALVDASIGHPYVSQLRYIIGLVLIEEGESYQKAIRAFKDVLAVGNELAPELVAATEIGLATGEAQSGQSDRAAQQLAATIGRLTEGPLLLEAFAAMEALDLLTAPGMLARLKEWSQDENTPRATLAQYYAIVAEERLEPQSDAMSRYAAFIVEHPDHPLVPQALLRQAVTIALTSRQDADGEALKLLKQLRNYDLPAPALGLVDFLHAKAEFAIADSVSSSISPEDKAFAEKQFRRAERAFLELAGSGDPDTAAVAQYDAAIAAMRADARASLTGYVTALEANADLKGDLLIERGLYLAAQQQYREARLALETFAEFSPKHPRSFHAHLALAEIAMLEFPPRIRAAMRHLGLAAQQPELSAAQKQQLDYTRFWLEESKRGGEGSAMVSLGNEFLSKWPESPWRDDVRMKLGEHYFRIGNYPPALSMFEKLEQESPDSELAEAALYFAGKASIRLNPKDGPERAIGLWNRIVRKGGQLTIPALHQQALVRHRQGKFEEAAAILKELLKDENVVGSERKAILCSLGETLFSHSRVLPAKLSEAEKVFADVVSMSDDAPTWRNQALYRLAKCHESAKNLQKAKDAYYSVFDTKTTPVTDYLWFYRAGFQLLELLKEEKQWDAAINVASRLAESTGPRAREAQEKAERLKLDQFRWEN